MKLTTFIIDAFTATPFKGNPAAVCHTATEISSEIMQSVARELNFPVTAFIKNRGDGLNSYDIRYFTTTVEIAACGHGTLASAKLVRELNGHDHSLFHTTGNVMIKAAPEGDKIIMSYPVLTMSKYNVSNELMNILHLPVCNYSGYSKDLETLFIEIDDAHLLRTLKPDYSKLVTIEDDIKELVITSISDDENYDYLLRSFCPWIGIDEDPVTGSVHAVLGNYWKGKSGKNSMKVYQASARGGELVVRAFNDRVEIGGEAVIVFRGELNLK
jgi:PhzF family phenazine biosynthesis protein